MIVVISPHLDDAVLSLGDHIAAWTDVLVLTVFAGAPLEPVVTDYDIRCGFPTSNVTVRSRRAEDRAALAVLDARVVHGAHVESSYVDQAASPEVIEELIGDVAQIYQPTEMFGPLGLHHSDHLLVGEAFRRAMFRASWTGCVYEELPYRVLYPEEVAAAFDRWRWAAFEPRLELPAPGFVDGSSAKRAALAEYRSQRWALDEHASLCPERVWRVR